MDPFTLLNYCVTCSSSLEYSNYLQLLHREVKGILLYQGVQDQFCLIQNVARDVLYKTLVEETRVQVKFLIFLISRCSQFYRFSSFISKPSQNGWLFYITVPRDDKFDCLGNHRANCKKNGTLHFPV